MKETIDAYLAFMKETELLKSVLRTTPMGSESENAGPRDNNPPAQSGVTYLWPLSVSQILTHTSISPTVLFVQA